MRKLNGDFGSGQTLDKRVVKKAAITVLVNSYELQDALTLMDMLGIIPPLPGNEPKEKADFKREQTRETRRDRVAERKAKKEKEMERLGVTPEEIGE